MRKVLIIALVLFLAMGTALAQTSKEICFRGIPWDTKLPNVVQALSADIGPEKIQYLSVDERTDLWDMDDSGIINQGDYKCFRVSAILDDVEAAGYPVDFISMSFLPSVIGECVLDTQEDSILYEAIYGFDSDAVIEAEEAFADLADKLSFLYGEPDLFKEGYGNHSYTWNGGGETSVVLTRAEFYGGNDSLYITYTHGRLAARLNELNEARNGQDFPKSAMDGL